MPKLIFLQGARRFAKQFTESGTTPYPNLRRVTSSEVEYELSDLTQKYNLLKEAANNGHCILKGGLSKPLVNESRRNSVNREERTSSLILDIDGLSFTGLEVPEVITSDFVKEASEKVVSHLPAYFQDVSYIAHASASMGMKGDKLCMHLDFNTSAPVTATAQKTLLGQLNLDVPLFEDGLTLTATGKALRYPLDRCTADNTRLIFIAPPTFTDVNNPFASDDDRFVLVEKANHSIQAEDAFGTVSMQKTNRLLNNKVKDLRSYMGLGQDSEKVRRVVLDGQPLSVCINPDTTTCTIHEEYEHYITYNIGGGDSHGYYVLRSSPEVMRNWKGETPVLFEALDPVAYKKHLELYEITESENGISLRPHCFRDTRTDIHYTFLYNAAQKSYEELQAIGKQNIEDFMKFNGGFLPDPMPQWKLEFNPHEAAEINFAKGKINLYSEPPMLMDYPDIPEEFKEIKPDEHKHAVESMIAITPNIGVVISSICGDDEATIAYFLNWLAFIFQTKEKSGTAWLFHGTQGTGKGILTHNIIKPLLDDRFMHQMRLENIEEQFNSWMEHSLFAVIDEFSIKDSAQGDKLYNKLKNYISEPFSVTRAMHKEQTQVKSYTNFIFTTNDPEPLKLAGDDRRFNVPPRQLVSLDAKYPDKVDDIINGIKDELPAFASLLMFADVDANAARRPLISSFKKELCVATEDTASAFIRLFTEGQMDGLLQVMDQNFDPRLLDDAISCQNMFRRWIKDWPAGDTTMEIRITPAQILPFYKMLVGNISSAGKLGKLLSHRGIPTTQMRIEGLLKRGYKFTLVQGNNPIRDLRASFLVDQETFIRGQA